jgi:putative PEP-CTERM system TPR-repeat lipoprotein
MKHAYLPSLVTALVSVFLVAGCDRMMSTETRIERAQAAFAAGRDNDAMADVKIALESEPRNVAGRVLLARLSLRQGDAATARKEIDRAIEAGADPASLADIDQAVLLAQGRYAEALAAARADTDSGARRHVVMATAHMELGDNAAAREAIDAALAAAPGDRDALLTEARWLWTVGRIPEATAALDRLLGQHPDFARAALYRARFAMAVGDAGRAREALEIAHTHGARQLDAPERFTVLASRVESSIALADVVRAESELKPLVEWAPDAFPTRYLGARVAYAKRDFSTAAAELRRALSADPDNPAAQLLLGAVLTEQGSLEQAASVLSRLVAAQPANVEARKQLARVFLLRKDPVGARRVLAEVPQGAARDAGADWMSGSIAMMSGDTDEGIASLEKAAAEAPDNMALKLDLARAYLLADRRSEAIALLQAIPESAGGRVRGQLLVLAEVAGQDAATAQESIRKLVRQNPQDTELKVVGAAYLLSSGNSGAAGELFESAVQADPRNIDAHIGIATVALQGGRTAQAGEAFRKALAIEPANERAHIGLAAIALAAGDRTAAIRTLEQSIGANPGAVESRLRLAELALADKDPARANALFEQALAVTTSRATTLDRTGQLLLRNSQFDTALARFNEAAALGNEQAVVNAAIALNAMGRTDDARARLESAVRDRPAWAAPTTVLVQLDVGQRQFDRALARIAAFQKAGGPEAAANELRGEVLMLAARPGEAADAFARAAKTRPSAALAIKTYRAARTAGSERPERTLSDWLAGHPRDAMVRLTLAEHYQQQGNRTAAIAEYEQATVVWPGAPALNNLAWLYYEVKDPRALELARRAHEAAPESADISDTYGWILLESGKMEEGLTVLEAAAKAMPGVAEIQYHYAAALARNGKKEAAATVLKQVIADNEDFPSRRDAEALLKTLS